MDYNVKISKEKRLIVINFVQYSLETLKAKKKNDTETQIYNMAVSIFNSDKDNVLAQNVSIETNFNN